MKNVISFIVGTCFGFALGCTFKDVIKAKLESFSRVHSSSPNSCPKKIKILPKKKEESQQEIDSNMSFNLATIKPLFTKYNVDLSSEISFSILLDKIERITYVNTLKLFASTVSSPEDLMRLLESNTNNSEQIAIEYATEEILISEELVNKILGQNGIDYPTSLLIENKIQLLVSFYTSKGLKQFQKTMGPSLKQFIANYEANEDVRFLYEEIMKNIKTALSFITQR